MEKHISVFQIDNLLSHFVQSISVAFQFKMMQHLQYRDDASETRAPLLIAVVVLLLCLSISMVGLRVFCRTVIREFGFDDAFVVLSLVSATKRCSIQQYLSTG